jgi:hypothetical protein
LTLFCFEQATLDDPGAAMARGVGARCYLWLATLWAARTGELRAGWRDDLPACDETSCVAIAAAAMDLAGLEIQPWERHAGGVGGVQAAVNAWYQAVTVMLFDANFMLRDAIVEGRCPDDEWHRHTLPGALQQAVYTTQMSFNTALFDDHERFAFLRDCGPLGWPADSALLGPAPDTWRKAVVDGPAGVRPAFVEALRARLLS